VFHACWQRQPYCDVPLFGLPKQKHLQRLSRHEINRLTPYQLPIIAWTNRIDRYFLQVQGSGELVFNSGDRLHIGYAGKNHRPYTSIGRYLYLSKKVQKHQLNMPGILHYLATHPNQQQAIFEHNASFVFFKAKQSDAVIGLMGVELKKELSAAVDNHWIPLGALIEVHMTNPLTHKPLSMLLTAQDTGSAIRGRHHIDVYMGKGKAAGKIAGSMKQSGKITYYTPN
jgi:membrane-bound lytic murein transglycosylase A